MAMKSAVWQTYNFGPANSGEKLVYGACRPGYEIDPPIQSTHVHNWLKFMTSHGIKRVVCLLDSGQLRLYQDDLILTYKDYFGREHVCHTPISDYRLSDPYTLHNQILPFLLDSIQMHRPVVVHCSGGIGRTGHILAAWLVFGRGFSPAAALDAVSQGPAHRDPLEAIRTGKVTRSELENLLSGNNKLAN